MSVTVLDYKLETPSVNDTSAFKLYLRGLKLYLEVYITRGDSQVEHYLQPEHKWTEVDNESTRSQPTRTFVQAIDFGSDQDVDLLQAEFKAGGFSLKVPQKAPRFLPVKVVEDKEESQE